MPESQKPKEPKACMVCHTTSDERVVLGGEYKGQPAWVCVRCLPMLIHGEH